MYYINEYPVGYTSHYTGIAINALNNTEIIGAKLLITHFFITLTTITTARNHVSNVI